MGVTGAKFAVYVVKMIIVAPLPFVRNLEGVPPVKVSVAVTCVQNTVYAVGNQTVTMNTTVMYVKDAMIVVYVV